MELKSYSVIINWNDEDQEEGTYAALVRAPNPDEAKAMARAKMQATDEGCWPFGSVVECSEGAAWAAADLEKALREILDNGSMHDDGTFVVEDGAGIERGFAVLEKCNPDGPAWGALHFDGSEEPDWSHFAYLMIDGCFHCQSSDGIYVLGSQDDKNAAFWTIYGREKGIGMAQALQDCVSRAEADHVLGLMMKRSGLPGYRAGEEMPEAITAWIQKAPHTHPLKRQEETAS